MFEWVHESLIVQGLITVSARVLVLTTNHTDPWTFCGRWLNSSRSCDWSWISYWRTRSRIPTWTCVTAPVAAESSTLSSHWSAHSDVTALFQRPSSVSWWLLDQRSCHCHHTVTSQSSSGACISVLVSVDSSVSSSHRSPHNSIAILIRKLCNCLCGRQIINTMKELQSFDWQTMTSQSACADETHHSFDHYFCLAVRIISFWWIWQVWSYTSKREICSEHLSNATLLLDFMSVGGAFFFPVTR